MDGAAQTTAGSHVPLRSKGASGGHSQRCAWEFNVFPPMHVHSFVSAFATVGAAQTTTGSHVPSRSKGMLGGHSQRCAWELNIFPSMHWALLPLPLPPPPPPQAERKSAAMQAKMGKRNPAAMAGTGITRNFTLFPSNGGLSAAAWGWKRVLGGFYAILPESSDSSPRFCLSHMAA